MYREFARLIVEYDHLLLDDNTLDRRGRYLYVAWVITGVPVNDDSIKDIVAKQRKKAVTSIKG